MSQNIAIGVLAYNEEKHIEKVIKDLLLLDEQILIVDDCSDDNTNKLLNQFAKLTNVKIIRNEKNIGAGGSTKLLLETAKQLGFTFLVKVDGDDQFEVDDVKKIINLHKSKNYQYIKSNRYWAGGIVGNMPKIRFFGNLIATFLMQIASGSKKLFDPLNGLFGITIDINEFIKDKHYPKRYGYPYYFTLLASLRGYSCYQINNVVSYKNQSSNLNSLKVFITILKLTSIFYIRKLKLKKRISSLQKSALYDILFLSFFTILFLLILVIIYIVFIASYSFISTSNLLILIIANFFASLIFFNQSFKEESRFRDESIDID